MTPDEQRAPKAFLRIARDGSTRSLSLDRPEEHLDFAVVELVARDLLLHYVNLAASSSERVKLMEADVAYRQARLSAELAQEEIDRIDDLVQTLEMRRNEVRKARTLKNG
jgi:hypothetical protein